MIALLDSSTLKRISQSSLAAMTAGDAFQETFASTRLFVFILGADRVRVIGRSVPVGSRLVIVIAE